MIRKKGISAQQNQTITVNQYTKLTTQNAEKLSNIYKKRTGLHNQIIP